LYGVPRGVLELREPPVRVGLFVGFDLDVGRAELGD
jgi:hypothetical protein